MDKKAWTPETIIIAVMLGSVCLVMIIMEIGIVLRAPPDHDDVEKSRAILEKISMIMVSSCTGFIAGRHIQNSGKEPVAPEVKQ